MSQHNEKNPHQHQSPLHDSSEAKPGMDSLAPEDGSHRPAAEPTPPGAQPTAPGSLKTHCVPVAVVQLCWKILFCARKSLTLTMSASRNVLFMHADQQLTVISSHIKA